MTPELDKYLVRKFPEIFKHRYAPASKSCMAWGLAVGDGWFNLIHALCSQVQATIDRVIEENKRIEEKAKELAHTDSSIVEALLATKKEVPVFVAEQVKEKFGTLRFYFYGSREFDSLVEMAEELSATTCEECGAYGSLREGGWLRTLCDKHAKDRPQPLVETNIVRAVSSMGEKYYAIDESVDLSTTPEQVSANEITDVFNYKYRQSTEANTYLKEEKVTLRKVVTQVLTYWEVVED